MGSGLHYETPGVPPSWIVWDDGYMTNIQDKMVVGTHA